MTINAAAALGLDRPTAHIEDGKHADLVVWQPDSYTLLPYWLGANLARTVVKKGRVVYEAGGVTKSTKFLIAVAAAIPFAVSRPHQRPDHDGRDAFHGHC